MMTKGILVPNEIVLKLLEAAMVKVSNTPGFLIDGYPREPAQGPEFEKIIAPVDIILYFECSDVSNYVTNNLKVFTMKIKTSQNTLVSRIMKRAAESAVKRADDNEETLKTRIATFRENTEKILVQYPTQLRRVSFITDSFKNILKNSIITRLMPNEILIQFSAMLAKPQMSVWLLSKVPKQQLHNKNVKFQSF